MSELFSIQLQKRSSKARWRLAGPAYQTESQQAALRQIGISSDNPQGLFISATLPRRKSVLRFPYNMVPCIQ